MNYKPVKFDGQSVIATERKLSVGKATVTRLSFHFDACYVSGVVRLTQRGTRWFVTNDIDDPKAEPWFLVHAGTEASILPPFDSLNCEGLWLVVNDQYEYYRLTPVAFGPYRLRVLSKEEEANANELSEIDRLMIAGAIDGYLKGQKWNTK